MTANLFVEPPVSVLSHLTALNNIDLSVLFNFHGNPTFRIPSPLLPILHPGLVKLDLRHIGLKWDAISLCHVGRALVEVADRKPVPSLLFSKGLPVGSRGKGSNVGISVAGWTLSLL
jgi:hypothetical protein